MALLDRRPRHAGNADAVAAHLHGLRLAVFIEESGVHRFAVARAEEEHMTDFNAALQTQNALAVGRLVAFDHIAQIHDDRLGQISPKVDARIVEPFFVRTAAEIRHVGSRLIGINSDIALHADRPKVTRLGTKCGKNFRISGKPEAVLEFRNMASLHFVEFVVSTKQHKHNLRRNRLAFFIGTVRSKHDALDAAEERQAQIFRHKLAFFLARRSALFQSGCRRFAAVKDG